MELAGLPTSNPPLSTETGKVSSIAVPQNYLNQSSLLHNHASSLVVIDPTVQNYQQLVAGVQSGSEVLILDPAKDAIDQITQALLGQSGISSIHLVSHGESGAIQLGETWLDRSALDRYQTEFKSWSNALTKDADILIYGCDVALGEAGRAFINQFSQLTGADLAASDDLTGSAALHGDWTLEVSTGKITAPIAFNAATIANYGSILPADLISVGNPVLVKGSVGLDNLGRNATSGDGRYVVFTSSAILSANDTNGTSDVFLYDRQADTVTLVSHNAALSGSATGTSLTPVISYDGSSVAFVSNANDLVGSMATNTTQANNIFVWERSTSKISLVSSDANGSSGTLDSSAPSISDDGSAIAFQTRSPLSPTDGNRTGMDVYVWDRVKGLTQVSQNLTGGRSIPQGADSPVISGDGNYVAFAGLYNNLTYGDTNNAQDIFLWQRSDGAIANLTMTGDAGSANPVINQDGSRVAFVSDATNFANDTNSATDVFAWTRSGADPLVGTIQLISVNSTGNDSGDSTTGFGNGSGTQNPVISRNGQAIAFTSASTNLVSDDTNGKVDVFVRNLVTNQTTLVSQDSSGAIGNSDSGNQSLSADGTRVAFTSTATNLVTGDTNAQPDVFVRDISTGQLSSGTTFLISRTPAGGVGNNASGTIANGFAASISVPVISGDGSTVAFVSLANNLSSDDTNSLFDGFVAPVTSGNATLISRRNTDPSLASHTGSGDSTIAENSISADARYVVFTSAAPEIVNGDTNGVADVFLRDRQTGKTTLISQGAAIANGASGNAMISTDGRYVVFTSTASNLVAGDSNNATDIFWVDTQTQTLKLVSHAVGGTVSANGASSNAVLSANGLVIAFTSTASNLVSDDTNNQQDVFVWNSQDGAIAVVSRGDSQSDGTSEQPVISSDGRYVAFVSAASNLVTGDTNSKRDVFVWDRIGGGITLVSRADGANGTISDGDSSQVSISQNGRTIAFTSTATDLTATPNINAVQSIFVRSLDTNTTILASVNQTGGYSASDGFSPSTASNSKISGDGKFVVFQSDFGDLVAKDTNGVSDVFVRDLTLNQTTLISINQAGTDSGDSASGADGGIGNGAGTGSFNPVISNDGRHIAFNSFSSNLVNGDTNNALDVFVRDTKFNTTMLASAIPSGTTSARGASFNPTINLNGSYVAFTSAATDLTSQDLNGSLDVFGLNLATTVSLSIDKTTTAESATPTPVNYTIRRNQTKGALTIKLAIDPSSTASSADYTLTAESGLNFTQTGSDMTLTLADGVAEGVITLTPIDDTLIEGDEVLNLSLAATSDYAIADSFATTSLTIKDNDVPVSVSIVNTTTDNTEGNTGEKPFTFTVKLSTPATTLTTVNYATQLGTGTGFADATDLTPVSGTLTFKPGDSDTQTVTVMVKGDTLVEPDETFSVVLSNPSQNAVLGTTASATATILNDDTPLVTPTIAIIGADSVTESSTGTQPYTFTVTLSQATTTEVKVDYAVNDLTTTSGSDYTAVPPGTLTFAPGEISKTITIPVLDNPLYETDEQFQIQLSNPVAATLPDAQKLATGTIKSNNTPPQITIETAASQTENTSPYNFTVKLSEASASPVTVKYSTIDGNAGTSWSAATASDDFTAASGTLTFAPGETSKTIAVPILNSTTYEQNETFSVQLTGESGATVATRSATATIVDTSPIPTVSISNVSQAEGNSGTTPFQFAVTLSNPSDQPITVNYATADGKATIANGDYQAASGSLTFAAGETTKTVTVNVNGNTVSEPDKTFSINLNSPDATVPAGTIGIGTIINDDSVPLILSVSPAASTAGGALSFVVSLSDVGSNPVSVNFATSDGTAKLSDLDYTQSTGTLTFAAGERTKTITVQTASDSSYEPAETVNLTLKDPVNATLTTASAIGTITSNLPIPSITIADPTPINEGNSGNTAIQFSVRLSNPSSEPISVQYVTKDGTADATDYVPILTPTTLTFAPGQTEQTITVQAIGDTVYESDATFTVELSNPTIAQVSRSIATATVLNDDPKPQLSIVAVTPSIPEGNSGTTPVTFEVSLVGATALPVTVNYSTVDGTATIVDNDYVKAAGTLTFAAGETKKTITVNAVGDTKTEGDETFQVALDSPTNATLQTSSATATIKEDDTLPGADATNSLYDILWHNQNTGANLLWQPATTLLDRELPFLSVPDPSWQVAGTADFNGDGITDIFWRNRTTGETGIWLMSPDLSRKIVPLQTVTDLGWEVQGIADFNRDGNSDILWRNVQTGENGIWLMRDTVLDRAVYLPKVSDPSWKIATVADFNNDRSADIFWSNASTGETALWLMNGATVQNSHYLPQVLDLAWQPNAAGDFNRDGFVDLLWRNQRTGENGLWLMRNGQLDRSVSIASVPPTNWQIKQVFDFNGDQNLDILWQNSSTQEMMLSLMNGETVGTTVALPNLPDGNWAIKGIGKFDTQTKAELLLRNAQTGENRIWRINPSPFSRTTMLDAQSDPDWQVQGTADFDRNGSADILWRNLRTREMSIWLTQNGQVINKVAIPMGLQASPDWKIEGIRDFSGDGSPDILWRNAKTGEVGCWLLNGTQFVSAFVIAPADLNWQIQGIADMNGDRNPDLIWRNTTTGEVGYWLLDRTQLVRGISTGAVDLNWQIQGVGDFNNDGQTDLIWRSDRTGETGLWLMNGTQQSQIIHLPTTPLDWEIVGVGDYNQDGQLDLIWRNQSNGANGVWYLSKGNFAFAAYLPSLTDLSWQVEGVNNF